MTSLNKTLKRSGLKEVKQKVLNRQSNAGDKAPLPELQENKIVNNNAYMTSTSKFFSELIRKGMM